MRDRIGAGGVEIRTGDGTMVRSVPMPPGLWPERVAWSPDGRSLAIVAVADNHGSIVLDVGGSTRVLNTPGIDFINSARWSSDGHRIVFVGGQFHANDTTQAIWSVGTDGTDLRVLVPSVDQEMIDVAGQP